MSASIMNTWRADVSIAKGDFASCAKPCPVDAATSHAVRPIVAQKSRLVRIIALPGPRNPSRPFYQSARSAAAMNAASEP
ncbi:hypothetical protein GGR04_004456 [Aureimonas pseudogalii]|uniref:Uncharacterized protein n=1 Tax=Aureimonas pseudogalii TaxID=1744844 RepID=A0A7W6H8K5_9HYPH|nr:hypothetical protein [Aureimonas pseudogalii]